MNEQTIKDIDRAFKALEERDELLDKIMTEIESEKIEGFAARNGGLEIALMIIRKYKEGRNKE